MDDDQRSSDRKNGDRKNGQPKDVSIEQWGRMDYAPALERQQALAKDRAQGNAPDTFAVVEHPPTITLGRHCSTDDLLMDDAGLAARGIAVERSDRGGRATYHGPGQVVVYPIVGVAARGMGAKDWVERLEDALLATLAGFEVTGRRICGSPGIWAPQGKIASLGLRIARGVSYHGVSINVEVDPAPFGHIVTCGIPAERISSIALETGVGVPMAEVASSFTRHLLEQLPDLKGKVGRRERR